MVEHLLIKREESHNNECGFETWRLAQIVSALPFPFNISFLCWKVATTVEQNESWWREFFLWDRGDFNIHFKSLIKLNTELGPAHSQPTFLPNRLMAPLMCRLPCVCDGLWSVRKHFYSDGVFSKYSWVEEPQEKRFFLLNLENFYELCFCSDWTWFIFTFWPL
jgi:hypothetical protein